MGGWVGGWVGGWILRRGPEGCGLGEGALLGNVDLVRKLFETREHEGGVELHVPGPPMQVLAAAQRGAGQTTPPPQRAAPPQSHSPPSASKGDGVRTLPDDSEPSVAAACAELLGETVLRGPPPRDAGVLCVLCSADGDGGVGVELGVAHCSDSMAVAYHTHLLAAPHVEFLRAKRMPAGAETGSERPPQLLSFGTRWRVRP